MIATNGSHLNGIQPFMTYPEYSSGYEPAPNAPKQNGWRDQLAPVTWSMSYHDSNQVTHNVTLRGDTEEEVMAMVKPLVAGIRKAKQQAKERQQQPEGAVLTEETDTKWCALHNESMPRKWSKRNNGHFWAHKLDTGDFCYGRKA